MRINSLYSILLIVYIQKQMWKNAIAFLSLTHLHRVLNICTVNYKYICNNNLAILIVINYYLLLPTLLIPSILLNKT